MRKSKSVLVFFQLTASLWYNGAEGRKNHKVKDTPAPTVGNATVPSLLPTIVAGANTTSPIADTPAPSVNDATES